jgi:hypothetical protein
MTLVTLVTLSWVSTVTRGCARPRVTCARTFAEIGLLTEAKLSDVSSERWDRAALEYPLSVPGRVRPI